MKKVISFGTKHFENMGNNVINSYLVRGAATVLIGLSATLAVAEGRATGSDAMSYVEYCSTDIDTPSTAMLEQADNTCMRIQNENDWNAFAAQVAEGKDFSGTIVRLEADIQITKSVGKVNGYRLLKGFNGTFDGCGHTLTAQISDNKKQGVAPFGYIHGATIKNLRVAGRIEGGSHFAAGLVGFAKGTGNLIQNCQVSADVNGSEYVGGLVGNALNSDLFIEDCIYDGLLQGGKEHKGALIGWSVNGGTKMVNDCLYLTAEAQDTDQLDLIQHLEGDVVMTNCYKTTAAGTEGIQIYTDMQRGLCKKVSLFGHDYYARCTVSGLEDFYDYKNGDPIATHVMVTCAGQPLVEGQDYQIVFKNSKDKTVDVIKDEDVYEMTVTATNEQFLGNATTFFRVAYCPEDFHPASSDNTSLQTNRK